uniref:Uncharacterized protein n=1 Tax=viral metagenome TaxID=1070528 RepID=A0A6M3IJA9_9ZZZZ
MDNVIIDEEVFKGEESGYIFSGFYLKEPKGEALIKIEKDGMVIKEFLFPAYKIWNIPAHAKDIVEGLERQSDEGLYIAGSDGLGGNSYVSNS